MTGKFGSYRLKPIQLPTNQSEEKKRGACNCSERATMMRPEHPVQARRASSWGNHAFLQGVLCSNFSTVSSNLHVSVCICWKSSSRLDIISLFFFFKYWHYLKLCMKMAASCKEEKIGCNILKVHQLCKNHIKMMETSWIWQRYTLDQNFHPTKQNDCSHDPTCRVVPVEVQIR